jgi:polysaccharide biosynthesis protein VpsQ
MRWLTVGFLALLGLIVLVADAGWGGWMFAAVGHLPAGDKLGHFWLMGIASLLINLSLGAARVRIGPVHVLTGSLAFATVVTLEETSQAFFRWRGASPLDLLADYAGIWLFGRVAARIVARREGRSTPTPDPPA